ncbi:hypothetical protein [Streptomyces sp. NPDC093589]|uniref:hypothetical protein n=1 Tax=Streptomyces sp. NPDC093589 TaxID=3366043 RepID=UPI00380AFB3E
MLRRAVLADRGGLTVSPAEGRGQHSADGPLTLANVILDSPAQDLQGHIRQEHAAWATSGRSR